jgi:hypothetical protein
MEFADAFCTEISKTLEDFVGVSENPVKTVKEGQASSADLFALRRKKNLSESTMQKITEPVFGASIRIAAQSDDAARAQLITRNLASACNDLAGDNELIRKDISAAGRTRFIRMVNEHQLPRVRTTYSVLSAAEVGKFVQIPGGELQDMFPAIEQIPLRETNLPAAVTEGGLQIGEMVYHGEKQPVYLPTSNHDELCLPHAVIGGMGCGKTMGFGANLAVEAVQHGMGAVVIDPAKGELGDEIESALPPEQVIRIRFGREPISLDWRECLHGERQRNRLASELVAFCEVNTDSSTGAQTLRYMRSAAKACTNGRLSEMVKILTNQKYREKILPGMREQEQEIWQQFNECSEARQNQIATPVLNRLDIITGDDYLYDCMEAEKGIDFVDLLQEPQAIILDIPKGELGTEAVDVLAALVATKLGLAMTLRKSQHPVFIIQDEPHQYYRSARIWKSTAVESRKWRFSYVWMFHAAEQIPKDVFAIIKSALPHYHLYTSSQETYKALASEIKPFDAEEAMATPMHWAINVIRAGGVTVTPFLAKMMAPPSKRK